MKKIILVLISIALLWACKKDKSGPKEIYLSKIIVNGETETEYSYNASGELTEERTYDLFGVGGLDYVYKYSYDAAGNLKEMTYYKMPANKPIGRYMYTVDGQGRIVRSALYALTGVDSGKLATYIDNEYNDAGQLIQESWKDEDEHVTSLRNTNYFPNGNLRASESYYVYNTGPEKVFGSSYGPSDTTLPASMKNVKAYPVNFYLPYLVSSYVNHFSYNNGQVTQDYREIITARQFNAKGLVIQQTITTKHIKPVEPDEVRVMQYEYVEF